MSNIKKRGPISYKFNFRNDSAVSCTVTNVDTGEQKTIHAVWPPSSVCRQAYAALRLDKPEDLK